MMEVRAEQGHVQENGRSSDAAAKEPRSSPSSSLKMFLVALSFAYFAKALSGSYMKSTITQLERRFDIPSYLIGVIDGSFEIGNLLVIAFVSYFGAKLHRPKIIGVGCVLMSIGTFIIALPHFIIGRYEYETSVRWVMNSTLNPSPCLVGSPADLTQDGCVQTISVVGPVFGYLLGSLCAKIYVDIGFVKMETITITPADARWVGAWWLGYLIAGVITLLSAIPFWFLPRSLPMSGSQGPEKPEQTSFIKGSPLTKHKYPADEHTSFLEMAKDSFLSTDFIPTLRTLLGHPVYLIYLCVTIIQLNSLIGMVTYKPKYIEQHFRQSVSKANFLMGVINIPAVALGMFSGGLLMKRLKLNIMGAAKFAFGTSLIGYILSLFFFAMSCENAKVAGVTLPYNRCIKPQLKSLALGFHALATRTLAGIPAPIYFGAIIDTTCLKWGQKKCGGIGACRIYNTTAYRIAYLGLTLSLRTISFIICIPGFILLSRQLKKEERNAIHGALANGGTELEALRKEEFVISNCDHLQRTADNSTDRETRL
ncbi:hypothetical protein PAMP_018684 [Pampus punctatissimus]